MQQIDFFIVKLIFRSTYFGYNYAHHQELKSYTDGCCLWYLVLWFTGRWYGVQLWVMYPVCGMFLDWSRNIPQTGHITHSCTPDQRPVNQSTK